jgi:uncharacterized protein
MNVQQNINVVQQGYEAFGRGDMKALLSLFDEDIDWRTLTVEGAPYRAHYRGRDDVARFFSDLQQTEEIIRFETHEFIGQGDRVVVLGSYSSKVRATGRTLDSDWVHVYRVRNGRITEHREYADTGAMVNAFQPGAVPA